MGVWGMEERRVLGKRDVDGTCCCQPCDLDNYSKAFPTMLMPELLQPHTIKKTHRMDIMIAPLPRRDLVRRMNMGCGR